MNSEHDKTQVGQGDGKFFVTTPIYYVNFKPHIGTSYTTILADVACRFERLRGRRALLLTGSDEHSQNIADLAEQAGKSPREYCDEMVPKFHQLWNDIEIQDYRFERTSDEKHHKVVQTFWQRIFDKGDVHSGQYPAGTTQRQPVIDDDEVPENPESHPRLKYLTEEAYYFRLRQYEAWLRKFHEANPGFVVPDSAATRCCAASKTA
jgi:methionyl-tRNA synthetase